MPSVLTAAEAAARFETTDTLGIPLGTGQPPALLEALGKRQDWRDLKVYGALLLVATELFNHPNVHYLSGFYGPIERALRDQGANISFVPADFRRFEPLLREQRPRVMAAVATPPDADGLVQPLASFRSLGRRDGPRRRGPGPGADDRGRGGVSPHHGHRARAPSRGARRPHRRPGRKRRGAAADRGPRARGCGAGDRRARRRLHLRRRHPADGHRSDPLHDRRAAGRGRRRRLRHPLRDVHDRADAPPPRRERSPTARDSSTASRSRPSRAAASSSTRGWTAIPRSPSCRSRWSTPRS